MKKKLYFLSIFILFLINICVVNAATYIPEEYNAQLYNNNNGSLSSVTTEFYPHTGGSWYYGYIPLVANSSGGAWGITSPVIFNSGNTYTFSARVFTSCGRVTLSTYNRIGIGTSLSDAVNSYTNNLYVNEINSDYNSYNYIQFAFESQTNGTYIVFPFSTTASGSSCEVQITNISITDLGSSGVSQEQINQSLQSQTNAINNSISNSTYEINSNIKQTEENINNTLSDLFKNCPENLAASVSYTYGYIYNVSGDLVSAEGYYASDYISVNPSSTLTISDSISSPTNPDLYSTLIVYDSNKNMIDFWNVYDRTFNLLPNAKYIRISTFNPETLKVFYGTSFECSGNKLDDLNNTQKETNNKLDNLNDNITDSDSTEATNEAGDFFSNFNTDTFGLTSVITAPLELIKSVTSKTCTPLQGTLPFVNTDVNLPCLSTIYENHFGTFLTIYRTITFGFVSYWVCIKIFNLVKDFKNPEHDEIEVLDL